MSYFLAVRASFYHSLLVFKSAKKQLKSEEEAQVKEEQQGGEELQSGGDLLGEERQETEKVELNLTRTLELCGKCAALEPKLATKAYRFIVGALLREVKTASGTCTV